MNQAAWHEPVLVKEVLHYLAPVPGNVIVDATLGHGGHALAILQQLGDEGLLVGIDWDPQMLAAARRRIEAAHVDPSRYRLVEADHLQLPEVIPAVLHDAPVAAPDGLLFDLGPSTPQLLDPARGLSWVSDAPLDMRIRPVPDQPTAAEMVNEWPAEQLARIFREHADERWANRIARRIEERRQRTPICTGRELGEVVERAIPRKAWPPRIHPATRVFLALRIEVNREYERLEQVLPAAFDLLKPGGRLVVITFHSGEDRRVKDFMRAMSRKPEAPWPLPAPPGPAPAVDLTRKAVAPGEDEIRRNPRSRSAKLRAIRKQVEPEPDFKV